MRWATQGVTLPPSLIPDALGPACLPGGCDAWAGLAGQAPLPTLSLSLPLCRSSGPPLFNAAHVLLPCSRVTSGSL